MTKALNAIAATDGYKLDPRLREVHVHNLSDTLISIQSDDEVLGWDIIPAWREYYVAVVVYFRIAEAEYEKRLESATKYLDADEPHGV